MMYRIMIIGILTVIHASIIDVCSKNDGMSQATIDFSQSLLVAQLENQSVMPTFDASDRLLDTAIQKTKTALGNGQIKTALKYANQALDHVKSYYNLISEEHQNVHLLFVDLYVKEKNYPAAEKHFQQVYGIRKKMYGEKHALTLDILEKLGQFYLKWDQRKKAEETLQLINTLYQSIYGTNHPKTLLSIDHLATFYNNNQEYSKARPYITQAVKVSSHLFGKQSIKNLSPLMRAAKIYFHCKSDDRALKTLETALSLIQKNGGKPADSKLYILQFLAELRVKKKDYKKAERLYQKAISLSRQVHGLQNTLQLDFNQQLIALYRLQGKHGKVKKQFQKNIELTSQISGKDHPATIDSKIALADYLYEQKEYTHATPIYEAAVRHFKKRYGTHEKTLSLSKRLAETYVAQSQYQAAESLLKENVHMYSGILNRTCESLQYLANIYKQQNNCHEAIQLMDKVFRLNESTLGPSHPKTLHALSDLIGCMVEENQKTDALNLLRRIEPALYRTQWEKLRNRDRSVSDQTICLLNAQTFCHAVFTLAREMTDPEVICYIADVMLRWQYLEHFPGAVRQQLPGYHDMNQLFQRRMVNLPYRLPRNSAFIHLYPYDLIDFSAAQATQSRWMGVLILSNHEESTYMFSKDLGAVNDTQMFIQDLMNQKHSPKNSRIEQQLYTQLFGQFEKHIQNVQSVYISTNGIGQMIPFSRLKLANGQYWITRQPVCRVFSALDFMKSTSHVYTGSLLAVGQVNYDSYSQENKETLSEGKEQPSKWADNHISLAPGISLSHQYQAHSDEAQVIHNILTVYRISRQLAPKFLSNSSATETALKSLSYPPRVLHLSVNCFYVSDTMNTNESVRGGLALAGANQGFLRQMGPNGQDGLLLDHEILNINLNGTELVFLTKKCDSPKIDTHKSAFFQMAAAFHMAGCRFVLSPIWQVKHNEASKFILLFYENWLRQSISNPTKALRTTKHQCILKGQSSDVWGSFVLMGF